MTKRTPPPPPRPEYPRALAALDVGIVLMSLVAVIALTALLAKGVSPGIIEALAAVWAGFGAIAYLGIRYIVRHLV
jgi:hypothetical protein